MSTYSDRKAAGVCVACGAAPARPGMIGCEDCAAKESARSKARRQRLAQRAFEFRHAHCIECGRGLRAGNDTGRCWAHRIIEPLEAPTIADGEYHHTGLDEEMAAWLARMADVPEAEDRRSIPVVSSVDDDR